MDKTVLMTIRRWHGAGVGLMLALLLGCLPSAQAGGPVTNASLINLRAALAGGSNVILGYTGTITTTNVLVISTNTTIISTNSGAVISGGGVTRVFLVNSNVTLIISNLTITGGKNAGTNGVDGIDGSSGGSSGGAGGNGGAGVAGLGGAMYNKGITTLINCTVVTNSAIGGNGGSGGGGGNGVSFGGNGGNGGAGGAGFGGGIYNTGTLFLSNCTVAGNIATGGTGGAGGTNGSGGFAYIGIGGTGGAGAGAGVYTAGKASAFFTNCTFNNNFSTGGSSQAAGGAPVNGDGQNGPAGAPGQGGDIENLGTNFLVNYTFFQNKATGGNGGDGGNFVTGTYAGLGGNGGNGVGGGIYNGSTGLISLLNCTLGSDVVVGGTNGNDGIGPYTNGTPVMGAGFGANIANAAGTFKLKNSALGTPLGGNNSYAVTIGITDQNNNLSSDSTPAFTKANSFHKAPRLDPDGLLDNGGPVQTLALQDNSPAINAIFDGSAPPFDARGVARPAGSFPCIGAYEFGGTNFSISGQITLGTTGAGVPNVTVQLTSGGNPTTSTVTDVNGDFSFPNLLTNTVVITPVLNSTNTPPGFFNPPSITNELTGDLTDQNFTASTNAAAGVSPSTTNSPARFSFTGIPNSRYVIQASTNLSSRTNWVAIGTNVFTNGVFSMPLPSGTNNPPQRFFRAVAQ